MFVHDRYYKSLGRLFVKAPFPPLCKMSAGNFPRISFTYQQNLRPKSKTKFAKFAERVIPSRLLYPVNSAAEVYLQNVFFIRLKW